MAKTRWTHTGTWASFDYFFESCARSGVPVTELSGQAIKEMRDYRAPRGGHRSRTQILRYLNAVLTDQKAVSSARIKLIQKMGIRAFSGYNEFYHLLEGPQKDEEFSVKIDEGSIELTDVRHLSHNSSLVSDGLMFLAKSLSLPVPYELEQRWIEQMEADADRDWDSLRVLAERDGKDFAWKRDAAISHLQVCVYIPYLSRLPKYSWLEGVPANPPEEKKWGLHKVA